MKRNKRSVFYLLIAIMLLFFVILLSACNKKDFYEQYGEPQKVDYEVSSGKAASSAEGTDAAAVSENKGSEDTKNTDSTSSQDTKTENTKSDDGSKTDTTDGEGATGGTDGSDASLNGKTSSGDTTSDQSNTTDNNTSDESTDKSDEGDETGTDDLGTDDSSLEYEEVFDLTAGRDGVYPYRMFDRAAENLAVFVGMERIGTATISEKGEIQFVCGFEKDTYELWGKWDDEGHFTDYVRFDFAGEFRQIVIRFSEAIQLDLTAEEVESLRPTPSDPADPQDLFDSEKQDHDQDPTDPEPQNTNDTDAPEPSRDPEDTPDPQGQNDSETPSDPQVPGDSETPIDPADPIDPEQPIDPEEPVEQPDPQNGTAESLPEQSAIRSFFEGIGAVSDLQVVILSEEEEEYSFLLEGTAEEYVALVDAVTPYLYYSDKTTTPEQYQATATVDGMVFNLFLQITKSESSFSASVKVLGESAEE